MKKIKIALIILCVLLIALPLFARGRRTKVKTPGLALSIYGGAENVTGQYYKYYTMAADSQMFYSFGANLIIPVYSQLICRFGIFNFSIHDDWKTYALGTGVTGDFMYYFPLQMTFTPYGFVGLWYTGFSSDNLSTTGLHAHIGAGGEMKLMYNLFAEVGLDLYNDSQDMGGTSTSSSTNPIFVHAGVRIPLIR